MLARHMLLAGFGLLLVAGAAGAALDEGEAGDEPAAWQELAVRLPEPPRPENLVPVYVSAATVNKFMVDNASLSVGSDGVVRYTLLVLAPAGGRNVTFEGMRCATKERRIYASGRSDGSWSKSRSEQWVRIQEAAANRHHASLFLEYFCPGGAIARNEDEVRDALRRGGYAGGWMRW